MDLKFGRMLVSLAGAVAVTTGASANDFAVTGVAGTDIRLSRHVGRVDKHCQIVDPVIYEIVTPPANGTLDIRNGSVVFASTLGTGTALQCNGIEMSGKLLFYRARAGFKGSDTVTFRFRWQGFSRTDTATVMVE